MTCVDILCRRALIVRGYIQIDRLDLAQKEVNNMQHIDDDATTTQLATAWLDIALVRCASAWGPPCVILDLKGVNGPMADPSVTL